MITFQKEDDFLIMRLSTSNGNINSGKVFQSKPGLEAFYEILFSKKIAKEFLDESNWNYDADYEDLIFQSENISFYKPKEEFKYSFTANERYVMSYNDLSWHITLDEVYDIECELKKLL